MKRFILILIGVVIFSTLQAQDVIFKKNGDEVQAKIEEVGVSEIKYKKFDNQDGPLYTILKSDVFMIKYANGTKEVFSADATVTSGENVTAVQSGSQEPATVIIYRKNSPSGLTVFYDVYADTKYITKVANNTYFATKVDPGLVSFNAMTEPPKVTASMNLEPGKTYYLKCGVSTGMWVGRPTLEFVSENTGISETAKMKK
ncbi:MAG TPA: hypothetical protein PKN48_10005 [Bacteroidales bacterium]|nr:hypothetical protein [Bacteroidales bacterium]